MTEAKGRMPLEAEYVQSANKAALLALADVRKRSAWGDSKYGSPVTTNLLCAEIARLQIEAHHSVPALLAREAFLLKALEEAKAALTDQLSFMLDKYGEFDLEDCDSDVLCPKCESCGCIKFKIDQLREVISSIQKDQK